MLVGSIFHLNAYRALLLTAQLAALGFWFYFFLFCERWRLSPTLRFFGAVAIVAHPAAFYLIAGYSESLFLMSLVGFIYWSTAEGRSAKILAALHGFVMSATRIVGIPCALFPIVRAVFENGWNGLRDVRGWIQAIRPGDRAFVHGNARRDRVFRLLPAALESVEYVYAHAGGRMGDQAGLLRLL